MEDRMIKFIAALRAEGVRVSLAESADAFLAVDDLGVLDRETFRLSLARYIGQGSGRSACLR